MTPTPLDQPAILAVFDALLSVPMASGFFDLVNGHEPKSAPPGVGLHAALWLDSIEPNPERSGGATVSLVATFMLRLYSNMLAEPQDSIDPNLMVAAVGLMAAYCGDFELGGAAAAIDLLGMKGPGLTGQAGYLTLDKTLQRVFDISIPVMIDDAFAETP